MKDINYKDDCPRCGRTKSLNANDVRTYSLSRRDNETAVCNTCGLEEAMFDFMPIMPPREWVRPPKETRDELKTSKG